MKWACTPIVVAGFAGAMAAYGDDLPGEPRSAGDPAGILESVWLDAVLSADTRRMSSLGIGAALSGDPAESRTRDLSLEEPVSAQFAYIRDPFDPRFARVVRVSLLRSVPTLAGRAYNLSGTLGFARGARLAPGVRMRNLFSARTALSIPLAKSWRANFRANYIGGTGMRSRFIGDDYETHDPAAVALAASLDYGRGRWHTGPFIQWSRAGEDVVNVAGASASYRVTSRATAYAAYYGYQFTRTDALMRAANTAGDALIVGFDYRL
ncbi:MAG TPA: hypothetical protein VE046_10945 [Steroidobacteraceae bacterium]|nr:hypothetical protein [Steroidobacteraceae bacterium]